MKIIENIKAAWNAEPVHISTKFMDDVVICLIVSGIMACWLLIL